MKVPNYMEGLFLKQTNLSCHWQFHDYFLHEAGCLDCYGGGIPDQLYLSRCCDGSDFDLDFLVGIVDYSDSLGLARPNQKTLAHRIVALALECRFRS